MCSSKRRNRGHCESVPSTRKRWKGHNYKYWKLYVYWPRCNSLIKVYHTHHIKLKNSRFLYLCPVIVVSYPTTYKFNHTYLHLKQVFTMRKSAQVWSAAYAYTLSFKITPHDVFDLGTIKPDVSYITNWRCRVRCTFFATFSNSNCIRVLIGCREWQLYRNSASVNSSRMFVVTAISLR